MSEETEFELKERDGTYINTTKTVLPVGDGPVRVAFGMGFSRDVKGVWLKPSVFMEVPVPDGMDVNEYIDMFFKPHIQYRLYEVFEELMILNGMGKTDDR